MLKAFGLKGPHPAPVPRLRNAVVSALSVVSNEDGEVPPEAIQPLSYFFYFLVRSQRDCAFAVGAAP